MSRRGSNSCRTSDNDQVAWVGVIDRGLDRVIGGILTVDETARLLENAPTNVVPYIAIGAFASFLKYAKLRALDAEARGR